MPPSYFPRAPPQLQRFLRANSFHATAISSPNSASPPLQHRNRGYKEPRFRLSRRLRSSTRSTLLPPLAAFPPRRGRESEVGIVACRVNRGKASLSRSNRSERERISAEFNVRGGCDCAPFEGRFEGRCARGGEGGWRRKTRNNCGPSLEIASVPGSNVVIGFSLSKLGGGGVRARPTVFPLIGNSSWWSSKFQSIFRFPLPLSFSSLT